MEITLMQGLLLALVALITGIDFHTEAILIFRPIITAFLAGLVLGDVQLGLAAGAAAELAYLGLLTVGGVVPPNPLVAGIMTVVVAYTTGVTAEVALGLSLPFALLMQWIIMFFNSAYAGFLRPLDAYAAEGNTKKFRNIVLLGPIITGLTYAVVVFLSAYAMQDPVTNFVNSFPVWLTQGFEISGGLLPGVGLALLLRSMLNIHNLSYLLVGFILATFLPIDGILPIAVIAFAVALLLFLSDTKKAKAEINMGGDINGGI